VAAVDWFAPEVAPPPVRRPPRPRPRALSVPRRAQGRRLRGGIFWISAFAVLLVGVVALNVAVLRMNMSVNKLNQQQLELQAQNATLASQVSSAGSSLRIEQAARRLGLTPAQAADTSYLDVAKK
jgi:cell division protein FtsL